MKHRVNPAPHHAPDALAPPPPCAKPVGVDPAAEEARATSRRQCSCLVEEEQLGPAAAAHHLAPAASEFADASEPCPARPAPRQRLRSGIVDDAAVAGEHPAMRRGDDVA